MIKHRWRELAKSFGNHVNPEKTEQLKRTKSEIENNVTRIFKLIRNEDLQGKKDGSRKDPKKESELVGLIENFYQQYQTLYALYDHLIGESGRIVRGRKLSKGLSLSSSSSDSDYYSSEEIDSNTELKTENSEVADLKYKFASRNEETEALNTEYMAALRKLKQADIVNKDLRIEELSALVEAHEVHGNQSSERIKELEGQLNSFKTELESLCSQKRDLEAWKEGKAAESKQLGEKNIGLHARIYELELVLKDKDDEISALQEKLKENEVSSTSEIADLTQARNLQLEVDSLRAQNDELEKRMVRNINESVAQVKGLMDQVIAMQKELESLRLQKTESEVLLDRKNEEISKDLLQIETLKEELTRKDIVEVQMLEERQSFLVQVKDMELEGNSLRSYKENLEKQITSKIHEADKLRQESEGLHAKISELEKTLTERGDEDGKNEASSQVMVLMEQVSELKQELDSLQTKKSQLELQIERDNKEYLGRLTQMENQNNELTGKIADQQRIIKEQEDTIKKFNKEHKQAKIWFPESKLNIQFAERKMEELAEKYRINFEDNVRLLYQRIRVAEQIHVENKESYRKMKERYELENRELKEKLATCEDPVTKMKELSETSKRMFCRMDSLVLKFEGGHNKFLNQISRMSDELQFAKTWVAGTTDKIKLSKHNADCLGVQLDDKEEQECLLREKVWKLEAAVSKEAGEKLNLMKCLSQLEIQVGKLERKMKEKDEGLLSLGEEKREAIRQLCMLIDHHRGRYDHLREVLSKRCAKCRTTT